MEELLDKSEIAIKFIGVNDDFIKSLHTTFPDEEIVEESSFTGHEIVTLFGNWTVIFRKKLIGFLIEKKKTESAQQILIKTEITFKGFSSEEAKTMTESLTNLLKPLNEINNISNNPETTHIYTSFYAQNYQNQGDTKMSKSHQSKYDQKYANNQFIDTAASGSNVTLNQNNYTPEQKQNLAESAAEIQQLLKQLEKDNPSATEAEQISHIEDNTTPKFQRRTASALKAAGETAIDEFILDNKYLKVIKATVKGWVQPDS